MFGMGGSEIIVILIVALLFLGPDKLPQATKQISKTIRDLKKQSRALQQQIEGDEQIGGAIRDLKSALRGDEIPVRRPAPKKDKPLLDAESVPVENSIASPQLAEGEAKPADAHADAAHAEAAHSDVPPLPAIPPLSEIPPVTEPKVTLPETAGEADDPKPATEHEAELAAMIKPATGTVPKGS